MTKDALQDQTSVEAIDAHRLSTQLKGAEIGAADEQGNIAVKGLAYTGEPLWHPWWGKFALDLSGGEAANPLIWLWDHNTNLPMGMLDLEFTKKGMLIEGFADVDLLEVAPNGALTKLLLEKRYPIQLSVYFDKYMDKEGGLEILADGETAKVNGYTMTGPGHIFRKYEIREVSAVTLGHDSKTEVSRLAAAKQQKGGAPVAADDPKKPDGEPAAKKDGTDKLDALTAENQTLSEKARSQEEKLEAQAAQLAAQQEQINQMLAEKRLKKINELAEASGIEFTEEQIKLLMGMDEGALAFANSLAATMKEKQPKISKHLLELQEQTTKTGEEGKSSLVSKAGAMWGVTQEASHG